jgi:trehalose 6-phosphate synthase/phosphatase
MKRIIIISNRLPVGVNKTEEGVKIKPSMGGLATGLKSFYKEYDSKWFGWSGFDKRDFSTDELNQIDKAFQEERCEPVFLNKDDVDLYYYGFSNETIWPLFHYFPQYTEYSKETWETYVKVNRQFADAVIPHLKPGDKVWVQDYHLMLLPKMIKDEFPSASVGFFLHIPFPSYEVFRLLPWRLEIIEGLLGADLIGFHTYDYERHFLSCVRRLLGHETIFNRIRLETRVVKVDAFPMGIDYDKFHNAALQHQQRALKDKSKLQREIEKYFLMSPDRKLIISIDRLDYSKGISKRLEAFEYFLENYPEFREKVTLILLAVPSRTNVEQYQIMKSEVDELVGRINGKFGDINWTPIWYFYRALPFEDLIDLYSSAEIALITPIRDGMNLVAKEYVASKTNSKGVLILSEMAGAAKELSEAIIVNPNNIEEIAEAIKKAANLPDDEQMERNRVLQSRLSRYNIEKWANDFVNSMDVVKEMQENYLAKKINEDIQERIIQRYQKAKQRVLFFDYDGTLVEFKKSPTEAKPDRNLLDMLDSLAEDEKNKVVLISGRDKDTFDSWFQNKKYTLIVEHGIWSKEPGKDWEIIEPLNNDWKMIIRPVIEFYVDRTPGTFIEEKNFSLVWHYRKADPDLGNLRAIELKDELTSLVSNLNLEIMEGNKVIEIKTSGINKGRSAMNHIRGQEYDFIFGIGDDWTDEYLFEALPRNAITIKVGIKNTDANYNLESVKEVRKLISHMVEMKQAIVDQ